MAIKFQLRGNSLDAYYAAAWKGHAVLGGNDTNLPITASAIAGVFGGSMIDMSQAKGLTFLAADNWAVGVNTFTFHLRMIPTWSGASSFSQCIFSVANSYSNQGGAFFVSDAGPSFVSIRNPDNSIHFNAYVTGTDIPFVANQAIDIYLVSDGTNIKVYANADGVAAALIASSAATTAQVRTAFLATSLILGSFDTRHSDWYLVEANILDTGIDPVALGVRTTFMTVPGNIERYAQSDVGVANVVSPNTYVSQGVTKTGTSILPAASDVKLGVSVGVTTGTAVIPAALDTRFGTPVGASTGLLRVPSPALVVQGTATDNTVGTLTFYNPPATPGLPTTCIVSIDMPHIMGIAGLTSAKLRARPLKAFEHTSQLIPREWIEADLDNTGHGSLNLVETGSLSSPVSYEFQIVYVNAGATTVLKYKPVVVPNTGTANLTTISDPL